MLGGRGMGGMPVNLRSPPSRRAMLATAVWGLPAVILSVPLPASATASAGAPVTVSTPGDQTPPSGEVWLTVTARSADGSALAGASLTLTGPSGARFGSAAGITDAAGSFSTVFDLQQPSAAPGSTVTVTAVVGGRSGSAALTVVGPFGSCRAG